MCHTRRWTRVGHIDPGQYHRAWSSVRHNKLFVVGSGRELWSGRGESGVGIQYGGTAAVHIGERRWTALCMCLTRRLPLTRS